MYDGSSSPTSTEINTAITDLDTLFDAVSPDSPQAARDLLIKDLMIKKLNKLNNAKRNNTKGVSEKTEPLDISIDDLTPLQLKVLMGSRGKTSPHLTVMDLR